MEVLVAFVFLFSIFNYEKDDLFSVTMLDAGKKSEVLLHVDGKNLTLDKINTSVQVNKNAFFSKVKSISLKRLQSKYKRLFAHEIKPPKSSLFYFESATTLTADSNKELLDLVNSIEKKDLTYITIIGHCDTLGEEKNNIKLSLRRANRVKKILLTQGMLAHNITVESYGERDLLIPTADNVKELRNRRVEVFLR